jgi:hypothetical protein
MRRVLLLAVAGLVGASLGCSSTPRQADTPPMLGATRAQPPVQPVAAQPAAQPAAAAVVPASYNTRLSSFDVGKDCKT